MMFPMYITVGNRTRKNTKNKSCSKYTEIVFDFKSAEYIGRLFQYYFVRRVYGV